MVIVDPSNQRLLFRGVADNDLPKKASKKTQNLNNDIAEMFKKIPPQT